MLSKYIQAPYIDTCLGLATPALIISVVYLLVLSVFLKSAEKKGSLKIEIEKLCDFMPGEKNKITISIIGYVVFICSCITLPEFLGKDNILLGFSKNYLKFESLAYLLLFAFLCTAFLNKTNRETHIKAANHIFHHLIWISLGTGILAGQLDYTYWKNMIVIVCVGVVNWLLFVVNFESIQEEISDLEKFDLIPYGPVKSTDDLFPLHRKQAEDLANIISCSSTDPFSICLSGKWGTGKTSVINGAVKLLKPAEAYDIIYINALELDDKKTVLTYLMTQIREKLKSRGVYVGVNSEYKEFASSFAGTITSSAIGSFLEKKFANDDDYRTQKAKLEEILERTYKNGKLIVVVDDIERCDRDTAREYLFLIKEVATMKSCVSVFVTDYDMLNKIVSVNDAPSNSHDFLNKFFNYRINLQDESPEDILSFYDGFFNERDTAFWSIYRLVAKSPGTWYENAVAGLTAKLNVLENDLNRFHGKNEDKASLEQKVQEQKACKSLFVGVMQNPRNVAKFYNVFRNRALCCGRYLHLTSNSNEVSKYVASRNIGQVLYLISFAEVFLPSEYERLKKQGPRYIDPLLYGINTSKSVNKRLLVELAQGLVFGGYFEFERIDGYVKEDTKKFIQHYLSGDTDLFQLVNPYTSQEEEWMNAISERNDQMIRMHWAEMVLMVFQKVPNKESGITNSWRNEKFLFLLEFAEEQVKTGVWESDKLFSLFDSDLHADRFWSLGTGLMQTFWGHLEKSEVYIRPSKEIVKDFYAFLYHYAYARSNTLYKLMHYLIPLKNDVVKTDYVNEVLLDSNNSLEENLGTFLKRIEAVIPCVSFSNEGWYNNLKKLAEIINDHLVKCDVAKYADMREDISHMLDTANEFQCLEKVAEWIGRGENLGLEIPALGNGANNIDAIIDFLEKGLDEHFSDVDAQREFAKSFTDFFKMLRDREGLKLTKDQSKRLHQLVEKYVEEYAVSSLPYRRTILNITNKDA